MKKPPKQAVLSCACLQLWKSLAERGFRPQAQQEYITTDDRTQSRKPDLQ